MINILSFAKQQIPQKLKAMELLPPKTIAFNKFLRDYPIGDSFASNPLLDISREKIVLIAKSNPKIQEILKKFKIPLKPNIEELKKLEKGHLLDTRVLTAKIYSNLPQELKSQINLSELQQGAMLHDYGKVLIPKEILNKKGVLNSEEYLIVQQHAELGAELLQAQGVNKNILDMIKYHHQNIKGNGYPTLTTNQNVNLSTQIISLADKYSALLENRSYKAEMSKNEALKILYEDVKNGLISEELFNAFKQTIL